MFPSLESIADAIAERVVAKLAANQPQPQHVPVTDEALAPFRVSARWLRDRQREGVITIQGPRGARFVVADELRALIAKSTIRRTAKVAAPRETSLEDAARAAAAELAARRAS